MSQTELHSLESGLGQEESMVRTGCPRANMLAGEEPEAKCDQLLSPELSADFGLEVSVRFRRSVATCT